MGSAEREQQRCNWPGNWNASTSAMADQLLVAGVRLAIRPASIYAANCAMAAT